MEVLQTSSEAVPLLASEEVYLEGLTLQALKSSECAWEVASLQMHPLPCTISSKEDGLVLSKSGLLQKEDSKIPFLACLLLEKIPETLTKGGSCERKSPQRSKNWSGEFHFPSGILKRSSRGQIYSLDFLSGERGVVGKLAEQERGRGQGLLQT